MSKAERHCAQDAHRLQKALAKFTHNACEITLVRHGETDWNAEHRLQGQIYPGPPLNRIGIEQARHLGLYFASVHKSFDAVYSSDLSRTVQTAEIVQNYLNDGRKTPSSGEAHHQLPSLVTDKRLRERHLAVLQGLTLTEARRQYPDIVQGLTKHNDACKQAGIESLDDIIARVSTVLDEIAQLHPGHRVLVISHGGALQAAHKKATGRYPKDKSRNCEINTLRIENKQWVVVDWGQGSCNSQEKHRENDNAKEEEEEGSFGGGLIG